MSDMAGKAARVAVEPSGSERDQWSVWESDIEGKTAREAASELGKERVSSEQDQEWSTNADLRKPWKLLRGLVTGLLPYWCLEA